MERVRSAFNKMMNSERYSRFSLRSEQERGSHVEVKLSDDAIDDTAEVNGQPGGSPTYQPHPPPPGRRTVCCLALVTLLIFIVGYLIGYVNHRTIPPACPVLPDLPEFKPVDIPEPSVDWSDITQWLAQKLTTQSLNQTLHDIDQGNRRAGSGEDVNLANLIYNQFTNQRMKPWTDIHYVQLQAKDSKQPNRILFGSEEFLPKAYLAYSAKGRVQGKAVYGNYGREEDLNLLKERVELKGCVMLLRAGRISFAQQVANAASSGAVAVLIYPDIQDYRYKNDTDLYGHVHLGSGDPYTPGFPSFNHTQFPPTRSSGLPSIPAQTITAKMAATILRGIGGPEAAPNSSFRGGLKGVRYTLGGDVNITVEVNNVLVNTEIHNVFGVIEGNVDPDRYVVIGAQRDSWGPGYARSTVGTALLMELARAISEMVEKDGFRPRRSLVFASWSAGVYGNVGSTEWLEGYMTSLERKAFTYISLDGAVMGWGSFVALASPLLHGLIEKTMKRVKCPSGAGTVSTLVGKDWQRPLALEDPAYTFLAFSGIPAVSFHFITKYVEEYPYFGTDLDNMDHLNYMTSQHTSQVAMAAAQFAGQMALRLVHDYVLPLDVSRYSNVISQSVNPLRLRILQLTEAGTLPDVSASWLSSARGSFMMAADGLRNDITKTDLTNREASRLLNERIMTVEHSLLSAYVAPQDTPFRHLLFGRGNHTLSSISQTDDMDQLRVQLALATWTLQGSADAMAEQIWDLDNNI